MSRTPLVRLLLAAAVSALTAGALVAPASAASAAAATGTIHGTFTDNSGAPLVNARVYAFTADNYDYLGSADTDQSGFYTIADVAPGAVKVEFDSNGLQQWAHGRTDFESATVFTVTAGATLTVDERLAPTGKIAGHLTDQAGASAPGVFVQAHPVDGNGPFGSGSTDEDGAYSLDLLPGTYQVSFDHGNAEQWAYGSIRPAGATTFTVVAGQSVTVDDKLLPTGSLGGHLSTAAGAPLTGTTVTLHRDGSYIGQTQTDESGDYLLDDVLPGNYQVSFAIGTGEQWVPGALGEDAAHTYPVVAGAKTTVDDSALGTGSLHGHLIDSAGKALAGYSIRASLDSQSTSLDYTATTDDNGDWRIDTVLPGHYVVEFDNPDRGRAQFAFGKSLAAGADRITVASGQDTAVDDTWLPGATVIVTLADAKTGTPLTNYCIWYNNPHGGDTVCTTDGTPITVTDQPAGLFRFDAQAPQSSYYLSQFEVETTLTSGQTTSKTVPLQLGGKITTKVTDRATGKPVADSCIEPRPIDSGALGDGEGGWCSDATGTITTDAFAAGTVELFAYAPGDFGVQWVGRKGGTGDQREAAKVAVKPGTTVSAPAVLLDKAGSITGTVTGSDGKPATYGYVSYSAWGGAGPSHGTDIASDGTFTFGHLGPYSWPLLFDASTGSNDPRQWSGGTGNRFEAKAIKVHSAQTTTYPAKLKPGILVKGIVTGNPDWRLTAINATTGDQVSASDAYGTVGGAYEMRVMGDEPIQINWYFFNEVEDRSHQGWYDHATTRATAKRIQLPARGTKKLNIAIS